MIDKPPSSGPGSDDLLLDIVETLEACGLYRDQYQLQDYVDVDELERLVTDSAADDVEVRLTVEGVGLSVSADGVHVLRVR